MTLKSATIFANAVDVKNIVLPLIQKLYQKIITQGNSVGVFLQANSYEGAKLGARNFHLIFSEDDAKSLGFDSVVFTDHSKDTDREEADFHTEIQSGTDRKPFSYSYEKELALVVKCKDLLPEEREQMDRLSDLLLSKIPEDQRPENVLRKEFAAFIKAL